MLEEVDVNAFPVLENDIMLKAMQVSEQSCENLDEHKANHAPIAIRNMDMILKNSKHHKRVSSNSKLSMRS